MNPYTSINQSVNGMFEEDLDIYIQAYLRDTAGLIPDHLNKAKITIKQVKSIFWFPSAYKVYVSTIVY